MLPLNISSRFALTRKGILFAALVVALLALAAVSFLALRWPFRREAVLKDLREASQSQVTASSFRSTYFPRPGCVLERVVFQHNPVTGSPPLITIKKLRIEGTFFGLFTRHVRRIRAEGLRVLVPRGNAGEHFQTPERSSVVIDELIADGAALEFASHDSEQQPLQFSFHNFVLNDVGSHGPASFRATLTNPTPPGEITTSGKFGPWNSGDVGKTPVSGEYGFQHADLGVFHGVAGELSSSGKFSGELNHIDVQGTTDTPAFTVTSSSHKVDLRSQFHAVVNGENGDTFLQQVAASFGKTTVLAMGSVAGYDDEPGKLTSLEFTSRNGRIQDLLLLFARAPRTPMSGTVSFHAKVSLPHEKRPFLQRVQLQGDFGIDAGSFSKPDTQESVNHLSQGALSETGGGQAKRKDADTKDRGAGGGEDNDKDDPAEVLSDLKGHVVLKDGTAQFSNLSFSVPGAVANVHGTYNLISEKIDLRGTLKTDSDPSKSTHGVKSMMLKVLDPFFKDKNKNTGYEMPVKITGTYDHPLFGLDLHDSDEKKRHKETERASQLLKGKP